MNMTAVTMPRMEAAAITLSCVYGLAGLLADNAPGVLRDRPTIDNWFPARVLDRLFKVAFEISGRGNRRLADRPATNRARVLRSDRSRTAQSVWAMVAIHDRTHAGVHLRRAGHRVGA